MKKYHYDILTGVAVIWIIVQLLDRLVSTAMNEEGWLVWFEVQFL